MDSENPRRGQGAEGIGIVSSDASAHTTTASPAPARNPAYLVLEVSSFLRRHDIKPARFGREAANDPRLVGDLFNGRIVRPATAAKVRAFMEARHV